MQAPDKLYLHPNNKGEVGANWLKFTITNEDESYIRVGALMQWAQETKAQLENDNTINEDIRKGAIWELEEIIQKIQSL